MLDWLKQQWLAIVLSILLAFVVWTVAVQESNPIEEGEFADPVAVTITGPDAGLLITNSPSREATVTLRAPRGAWLGLSPEDIQVTADLTGLGPGTHQVPLSVDIATTATLVLIRPSHIRVTLEEEQERDMPVRLTFVASPVIGYRVGEPVIEPASAIVRGPASLVDQISELRVEVPVDELRESYEANLPIVPLDSEGQQLQNIGLTPPEAHVVIPVTQESGYKQVSVVVRTEGQPAQGYFVTSITTSPLSITVRGNPVDIARMPGYVETVSIDLTGLQDDLTQDVALVMPTGVTPVERETVEVQITIGAQQGTRVERYEVVVENLPSALFAALSPEVVEVTLAGPLPALDALSEEDVQVTIDLTDYMVGSYQIEPTVTVRREQVTVASVLPQTVQISITTARGTRGGG
jgi:YbbR domain-containing protein